MYSSERLIDVAFVRGPYWYWPWAKHVVYRMRICGANAIDVFDGAGRFIPMSDWSRDAELCRAVLNTARAYHAQWLSVDETPATGAQPTLPLEDDTWGSSWD